MRHIWDVRIAFKRDAVVRGGALTSASQKPLSVKTKSGNETFSTSDHPYKGDAKVDANGSTSKCILNTDKEDTFSVQQRHKKIRIYDLFQIFLIFLPMSCEYAQHNQSDP
jgi:hypothetical protein